MIDNYIFQKEIKEKFSFQYKLLDIVFVCFDDHFGSLFRKRY